MEITIITDNMIYELGSKMLLDNKLFILREGRFISEIEGKITVRNIKIKEYSLFSRKYSAGESKLKVALVKQNIIPLLRPAKQQEKLVLGGKNLNSWPILE